MGYNSGLRAVQFTERDQQYVPVRHSTNTPPVIVPTSTPTIVPAVITTPTITPAGSQTITPTVTATPTPGPTIVYEPGEANVEPVEAGALTIDTENPVIKYGMIALTLGALWYFSRDSKKSRRG